MSRKRPQNGADSRPNPKPLMDLSTAYWGSQTLFTAIRLGIFEGLANGPRTSESLARTINTQPHPTQLLLKACVALGLIKEDSIGFSNSDLSETFLVPGTDYYLGNSFRYADDLFSTWGRLQDAVTDGKPAISPETYLGGKKENTTHFVYGMHNRALAIGGAMTKIVDLSGRKKLLDIGGGPGTLSCLFAKRYPDLRAQVLDLPDIVTVAAEIILSMGVSSRVSTIPGDYKKTEFPATNDVVLISGVFHRETEENCRKLMMKASDALADGGMIIIIDIFTDAGNAGPLFSTLFGLNMLLTAEDGGVHADIDVMSWLSECGFENMQITPLPPPMPHRIITGYKDVVLGKA